MLFRPCGECTACCSGNLIGNSYGNFFGKNQKCIFLVKEKCSIYENRPDCCRKYQCAWTQGLLDQDLRPDRTGLMVSVEVDQNKQQYFKVVELWETVPYEEYTRVEQAAATLGTYCVTVKKHEIRE